MAKSGNSLLNSLRGIIWISTTVLAFFITTFGLISYLVVTLLTSEVFYAIFIPFLFLSCSVIVFGWWLSNELLNPIEKVTLLAKSLERNSSTSLPKTSGSSETDQLLLVLHRNSQQMQNVVTLMDKVANGNVDVTLTPLKGSDRLSSSFQRLLSKVSESINAKEELTKLEQEIEKVKTEIVGIRNGNLNVEITTDYGQTKEISETIKYLVENLTLMISLVKVDSHQANDSADEVEKTIRNLIKQDESNIQEINQASIILKQIPNLIDKISKEIISSAKSAEQTIEKTKQGTEISHTNSESVAHLRSKLREAVNRIQSLNERSQEIGKVAKSVEDLSNRTNMIALNASIQATELGEEGRGFVLISEELERLATRADGTNKQLSVLNKSILTEIGKVENSLKTTMGEVAELSKFAIENKNILGELERYIIQFLNLQESLIAISKDQSEETDEAYEKIVAFISNTENNVENLKESATQIKTISLLMKNLQTHTSDFRVISENNLPANLSSAVSESPQITEEDSEIEDFNSQQFSTEDFNAAKLSTEEYKLMTSNSAEFDSEETDFEENLEDNESSFKDFFADADDLNLSQEDSKNFDYQDFISKEFTSEELNFMAESTKDIPMDEFNSKEFESEKLSDDEDISEESFPMNVDSLNEEKDLLNLHNEKILQNSLPE